MATILQKAVTPPMSAAYLERGLDRVAGYVVPAADVAGVTSTAGLFELHGLGFAGTPFSPDAPIDVLHLPVSPTAEVLPATGGQDEEGRRRTGGQFLERPPFTGTGLTATGDVVAPLSWIEHTRLTPGTRLWRFTPGEDEPELIGTYHGVAFGWQNHLDGDSFHAIAPTKFVGHVAKIDAGTFAADVATDDAGRPTVLTLASPSAETEQHGFTRTEAGMWARKIPAADAEEIFEIHATARWHGVPVRIVDQGPDKQGEQQCRVASLAHDADVAERLHMDKLDAGAYETTTPLSALTDVVYAQRVPRGWAREGQLRAAAQQSPAAQPAAQPARRPAGAVPTVGRPVVSVGAADGGDANPMARHAAHLQRIAQGLVSAAPSGWTRARVLCRMVGTRGELLAAATGPDGKEVGLPSLPGDVGKALAEMRHASFEPGKGTWFAALVTLEPGGKLTLNLDYTHEQRWSTPLEAGQYAEDLRRYPRDEDRIPDWLRERLAQDEAAGAGSTGAGGAAASTGGAGSGSAETGRAGSTGTGSIGTGGTGSAGGPAASDPA